MFPGRAGANVPVLRAVEAGDLRFLESFPVRDAISESRNPVLHPIRERFGCVG